MSQFQWPLALLQGGLNWGQQQQTQQFNQQALADSLGLQSLGYGQTMGVSPGYLSGMLGYGVNSNPSPGNSAFSSPYGTPGSPDPNGGFLGLGGQLNDGYQRDIFGRVVGGSGPQQSGQDQANPRGGDTSGRNAQMLQNARLRPGATPMGRHSSNEDLNPFGAPVFPNLPDLVNQNTQGYWDRANTGAGGVTGLQNQMMGAYGQGQGDIRRMTGDAAGGAQDAYGALGQSIGGQGNALAGNLQQGYQDRFNRNINRIAGLGAAEEQRIRDDYGDLGASQDAGLSSRGLGSSTIRGTMAQGRQREMTKDLGDLGERLRREITGYDTQLSGDMLGSMANQGNLNINRGMGIGLQGLGAQDQFTSQGLAGGMNLLGQGLMNQSDLGRFGLGFNAGLSGDALQQQMFGGQGIINMNNALLGGAANSIESVNRPYPQGGLLDPAMNLFAAQNARPSTPGYNPTGDILGLFAGLGGGFLSNPGLFGEQ